MLGRKWACCDSVEEYVKGAKGRFKRSQADIGSTRGAKAETYSVPNPLASPNNDSEDLSSEGGKTRTPKLKSNGNGLHLPPVKFQHVEGDKMRSRRVAPIEQMRLLEEPVKYKTKHK
jgi:hypothetical protein